MPLAWTVGTPRTVVVAAAEHDMIVRSGREPGGRAREHRHRGGPPGAPRHRPALHRRPHRARRSCGPRSTPRPTAPPPFWDELAGLGWLGLHLPEAVGGEGYGFAELAVVVEELGRALAPGPFLPTVLGERGHPRRRGSARSVLERLARGERRRHGRARSRRSTPPPATTARSCSRGTARPGAVRVASPTSSCVPARSATASAGAWSTRDAVDGHAARVARPHPPGRRGRLRRRGRRRRATSCPALDRATVERARRSRWPRPRPPARRRGASTPRPPTPRTGEQFGRPIGQFQGVKHRCADMLVALEQARAVAWDAALALDDPEADGRRPRRCWPPAPSPSTPSPGSPRTASRCSAASGSPGSTTPTSTCGAPWPCASCSAARRPVAGRGRAGRAGRAAPPPHASTCRRRPRRSGPRSRAFADEIAAAPKEERRAPLADAGLIVPHWAPPWGRDAGAVEQLVIDQELRRVKVRVPAPPGRRLGGADHRRPRHDRAAGALGAADAARRRSPGASSSASPRPAPTSPPSPPPAPAPTAAGCSTARRCGRRMAKEADWGICLVRTNPTAPKHLGITYVDRRHEVARASTSGRCAR